MNLSAVYWVTNDRGLPSVDCCIATAFCSEWPCTTKEQKEERNSWPERYANHMTDHVIFTCVHVMSTGAAHSKMTSATLWAEIKEEVDWYYRFILD